MKVDVKRAKEKERLLKEHFMTPGTDCVLVSVDFSRGQDTSVMIIGRQNEKGQTEIVKAYQGKQAEDLYFQMLGEGGSKLKELVDDRRGMINVTGSISKLFRLEDIDINNLPPIKYNNQVIGKVTSVDVENNKFEGQIEKWVLGNLGIMKFMGFEDAEVQNEG